MNKRFNYEQWYSDQNNQKSNLLYERLTKQFVGRGLLNEQDQQIQAALNYDLTSSKELMDKTKKTVGDKLSTILGIDMGTTEGQHVAEVAARFVLNHVVDIQIKGQEKPPEKSPSLIKDLGELLKEIVVYAAKENKELFNQFSSASRAKAATDVIKKQAGKDFEEFGSELSRTGKQAWSDVKSGVSNLFEAAPAAAAGAAGTAIVTGTAQAVTATSAAVAPQAAAAATLSAKIIAGAGATAAVAEASGIVVGVTMKAGVIIAAGLAIIAAILQSAGLVNLGLKKITGKAEKAAGMKTPGLIDTVFGDDDDEEEEEEKPKEEPKKKKKIKCSDEDYILGKC